MNDSMFRFYQGILTEAEWLTAKESWILLTFLEGESKEATINQLRLRPSERKWRLFACATVQSIGNLIDNSLCRKCLEIAELYADGLVDVEHLEQLKSAAEELTWPEKWNGVAAPYTANYIAGQSGITGLGSDCSWMARWVSGMVWQVIMSEEKADFDFDIKRAERDKYECELLRCIVGNPFHSVTPVRSWMTPKVKMLAQTIYEHAAFKICQSLPTPLRERVAPTPKS